jgi:hypothetical protein
MDETTQKIDTLSIFVHDSIFVLEKTIIEIIVVIVAISNYPFFSAKEKDKLREVLRISLGDRADELSNDDLSDFGASMLLTTALVLKARYLNKKAPLEK